MFAYVESAGGQGEEDSIETRDRRAADAWAVAMADLLWSDQRIRARMSVEFQKVVDQMVIARFGDASAAKM